MTSIDSRRVFRAHSWWTWLGVFVILAATFLCYAATLKFGFAYDDFPQIVDNPRIRSVHFLPQFFVSDVWAHAEGEPQNLYRPIFLAWLLANFKSFALRATYWHLTTLLLHLLMVFLVCLLARKLLPEKPVAALLAAAVFALHPSHVEAVAWISAVTEPLSGAMFVGSFLCYLNSRDTLRKQTLWRVASLLLAAGAMLTKETAIVLPAVILAYEWLMEPQEGAVGSSTRRWRSWASTLWPYALVAGGYFILRFRALHGMAHGFSDVPLWKSVLSWPLAAYFYLSQLLVPIGFGPYYDAEYASRFNLLIPIVVLTGAAVGIWWWSRKSVSRLPIFLACWFLLTLAPALALFSVVWRYDNLHDRYLYLPSVAVAILAGQIAANLAEKLQGSRRKMVWAGSIAVLALFFVGSYRQGFYWKDNLTLYRRGAAVAPHNLVAKLNLASELFKDRYYEDAFTVSEQAFKIDPNSRFALTDIAQASYYRGDYKAAEDYYLRAFSLGPPSVDQIYYLSLARIKEGRYREALLLLQQGISRWPGSPGYHAAMGQALAGLGAWEVARDEYKLELKLNPTNPEVRNKLAEAETHLR